jgi:hypothetical protein
MLIQVDKLVQLIESPVFTCKSVRCVYDNRQANQLSRSPPTVVRAREVSVPVQVHVRHLDASSAILGICRSEESSQQCQLYWLSTRGASNVSYMLISSTLLVDVNVMAPASSLSYPNYLYHANQYLDRQVRVRLISTGRTGSRAGKMATSDGLNFWRSSVASRNELDGHRGKTWTERRYHPWG